MAGYLTGRVYISSIQKVGSVVDFIEELNKYSVKYLNSAEVEKIGLFDADDLKEQPELPFGEEVFNGSPFSS